VGMPQETVWRRARAHTPYNSLRDRVRARRMPGGTEGLVSFTRLFDSTFSSASTTRGDCSPETARHAQPPVAEPSRQP
jgi:hypothetical protein